MATFKNKRTNEEMRDYQVSMTLDVIKEKANNDLEQAYSALRTYIETLGCLTYDTGIGEKSAKAILDSLKFDAEELRQHIIKTLRFKREAEMKVERLLADASMYIDAGKLKAAKSTIRTYIVVCSEFGITADTDEFMAVSNRLNKS